MQFLLISKNSHPSIQRVYSWGPNNQSCKSHESIKSKTEHKGWQCKANIQIQQSSKEK